MTPDPDDLQVMAVSRYIVECLFGALPYDRYAKGRRAAHERKAHLLLNGLQNAGYTLTTEEG